MQDTLHPSVFAMNIANTKTWKKKKKKRKKRVWILETHSIRYSNRQDNSVRNNSE